MAILGGSPTFDDMVLVSTSTGVYIAPAAITVLGTVINMQGAVGGSLEFTFAGTSGVTAGKVLRPYLLNSWDGTNFDSLKTTTLTPLSTFVMESTNTKMFHSVPLDPKYISAPYGKIAFYTDEATSTTIVVQECVFTMRKVQ